MNSRADAIAAIALRRTQSLSAIVRAEIERMILTGELAAGARLNEQSLAARLGVSRGPVREATRALERSGLVTTIVNQGVYVRRIDAEEAAEIYDLRGVVFGFACHRLAGRLTAEQHEALAAFVARMAEAIARDDPAAYYELNLGFHAAIMDFAGHRRAKQSYEALILETHLTRRSSLETRERMRESNGEHEALVAALGAGDASRARELGEAHAHAGKRRWLAAMSAMRETS